MMKTLLLCFCLIKGHFVNNPTKQGLNLWMAIYTAFLPQFLPKMWDPPKFSPHFSIFSIFSLQPNRRKFCFLPYFLSSLFFLSCFLCNQTGGKLETHDLLYYVRTPKILLQSLSLKLSPLQNPLSLCN